MGNLGGVGGPQSSSRSSNGLFKTLESRPPPRLVLLYLLCTQTRHRFGQKSDVVCHQDRLSSSFLTRAANGTLQNVCSSPHFPVPILLSIVR